MNIKKIEQKYNFTFPIIFQNLWNNGMIDWFKGWDEPWTVNRNWFTEIYPTIKDKPPLLLHTNNDMEMLPAKDIINYEFPEWWDTKHQFIPFAKTGAGDIYAFYKNGMNKKGEFPIVIVWHDDNCIQYLSQNFEDFIFRQMLECPFNYEGRKTLYFNNSTEFQLKIQYDLKTVKKYLNKTYTDILQDLYSRDFSDLKNTFTKKELDDIIKNTIKFDLLDTEFKHEG